MSDKIKPWQQRKPKHHGQNEKRGKRNVPRGNERPFQSRLPDDRDVPVRNDWNERWGT